MHELVKKLNLLTHPEGGYFSETLALGDKAYGSAAEWCGGKSVPEDRPVMNATMIYYLLTAENPIGKMHTNDYAHFHLWHQGKAQYTLINPKTLEVKRIKVGNGDGEVMQLFVRGGWWKASEVIGASECLVSEVVVPGWTPQQNRFLNEQELREMWGKPGWEEFAKFV